MVEQIPTNNNEENEVNNHLTPEEQTVENTDLHAEEEEEEDDELGEEHTEDEVIEDYSELSKGEIISRAHGLLHEDNSKKAMRIFAGLKAAYEAIEKTELPALIKAWVDAGNEARDFRRQPDTQRQELDKTIVAFKKKRAEERARLIEERLANYKQKQEILNQMKTMLELEETEEGLKQFKHLMNEWRQIRQVPKEYIEELNKTFEVYVDQYFDTRKMHQELYEVDRQKNMDHKIELIQKVQQLQEETNIRKSLILLKQYREEWRTTGPVKKEYADDLWQRFQKIMQEVYDEKTNKIAEQNHLRDENLKLKQVIAEKAELAMQHLPETPAAWAELGKKMDALMQEWKNVGPVSRKEGDKIWQKFNGYRGEFYTRRKAFYGQLQDLKQDNLVLKLELCSKAEALANSTDWRNTTEELKKLQEEWKKIGPVPESEYKNLWNRFRKPLDTFFEAKQKYFSELKAGEAEVIKKREELIAQLEELVKQEDKKSQIEIVKSIQQSWNEAGHVSGKSHFTTYRKYRSLCDEIFNSMRNAGIKERENYFKEHLNKLSGQQDPNKAFNGEERRIKDKIRKISDEINTIETNKNFFANTKNAQAILKQFDSKIQALQEQLDIANKELHLLKTMSNND